MILIFNCGQWIKIENFFIIIFEPDPYNKVKMKGTEKNQSKTFLSFFFSIYPLSLKE